VHTHPFFRSGLWPVVYGANKAVFLRAESDEGLVRGLRENIAARYQELGASVRLMHDGAPMVDIPELARPAKSKMSLGARLRRLVRKLDPAP